MDEYINRGTIKEYLKRVIFGADQKIDRWVDTMPAADVVPVVHSRWELHGDGSGTCQHCHRTQTAVWDFDGWQRFCGDCGAKMDD